MTDHQLTTVFGQLRSLARHLDHGVVEIEVKINEPKRYVDDDECCINANRHLQNTKKEICVLKDEAMDQLCALQLSNNKFQQILDLLPNVLSHQRQTLTGIEDYLQQYGYKKQDKKTDTAESEVKTDNLVSSDVDKEVHVEDGGCCDNGSETTAKVEPSTPDAPRLRATQCKTPQLEDFGISDHTMNLLRKGVPYELPKTSSYITNSDSYTGEQPWPTPTAFKHNGIFLTSSLMKDFKMPRDNFNAVVSNPTVSTDFTPSADSMKKAGPLQSVHMSTVGPTGSPVPPILRTPGAKQINKKLYIEEMKNSVEDIDSPIPPLLMTPGFKQISKQVAEPVKKGPNVKASLESPTVPILMTPGAKQIQKTIMAPEAPALRSRLDWDKEPEMPELTMSFQDITQLTQSFRQTKFYADRPPEPPVTQTMLTKQANTPPLPDMFSTSITTPPPPALLGKYRFFSGRENVPP